MKKMRKKMIRKRRVVKNHQRILAELIPSTNRNAINLTQSTFKAA